LLIYFLSLICKLIYLSLKLNGNGSFPQPLSAAEEKKYLALSAAGDIKARNILIEHNLRLVAHVIKKYYSASNDQDDLISIGIIGLIKAIKTFDSSKNTRLATYAAKCVENEIFMHFRTLRRQSCEISLSEPIDTDSEGNTLELMDILCFEDDMLDNLLRSDRIILLKHCIENYLDEREKEILKQRYGLCDIRPKTQREVAQKLGISRSYVSRIEKKTLEKLRAALQSCGNDEESMPK
jgi:RNA polymerase sporulation-specific sigma factor